ncbi:unnamed protein product [Urochloa decumbens]|uniref:F-box domain-containing protein n=1 Tax=Urochloa decumbens TaxID=240449 RepID=A0ABC9FNF3_9POAL
MASSAQVRDTNTPRAPLAVPNGGLLPTDVLHDILLRLPADVLCRLHLVCRSWRSLTSDPIFAEAHLSRHPLVVGLGSDVTGPARRRTGDIVFSDLSGNIVKRIYMRQAWEEACVEHGPLCICQRNDLSVEHGLLCILRGKDEACVVNPATAAFTVLSTAGILPTKYENKSFLSTFVLGHVPSTGEYKVLRIIRHQYDKQDWETCDVMTLGSNGREKWRVRPRPRIQIAMDTLRKAFAKGAAYAVVNGVAYFLSSHIRSDAIASFDFATEKWRHGTLQGPLNSQLINANANMSFSLANLNGCLVTICRRYIRGYTYDDCSMDLWFLTDVENGLWTKRYSLRCRHADGLVSPVGILDDDEKILLWAERTGALRTYDPRTSIATDLSTLKGIDNVGLYQGSLLYSDIVD